MVMSYSGTLESLEKAVVKQHNLEGFHNMKEPKDLSLVTP